MPFDAYGGRTDISCPNGSASHFYTQKIGNRWWLCTPLGHGFFYQGVGAWQLGINASPKYGTTCQTAAAATKEVSSWNFNGVGEISNNGNVLAGGPCNSTPGFVKMPRIETVETSLYATAANFSLHNFFVGYINSPVKNITFGCNKNAHLFFAAGLIDVFDPLYTTFANSVATNILKPNCTLPGCINSGDPYNLGVMMDDTDFLAGMGGSANFDTTPAAGHNKTNLAYIIATASPVQTWAGDNAAGFNFGNVTYNNTNVFYSSVQVYAKNSMASPPIICNTSTPCTYATFLQKKYSTIQLCAGGQTGIAGLNTCWGSNYSVSCGNSGFGSCGQCVGYTDSTGSFCGSGSGSASEPIGTGDGSTTVFNHTLSNIPVSAQSVQLILNTTDILTGDCPGCGVLSGGSFLPMFPPFTFNTNTAVLLGDHYLDSNGYLQTVTTAGTTGSTNPPTGGWSTTYKGNTTSGTAIFRNDGPFPLTGPQPFIQDDHCTGSGSGFAAASFWAQIVYHGTPPTGSSNQIPSRLAGTTCSSSGQTVFVTGPDGSNKGQGNPPWATGYDVYMSCRNQSGGAANGCAAAGPNVAPPLTLQASNVPLAQITTISCAAGVVTINTSAANGFTIGDTINLFKTSGGFDLDHNNPTTVASTPLSTQFTYNQPGGSCPSASGSGGTVWKWYLLPNAPMASGSPLPTPPSVINYTTGAITLTFSAPLQNTIPITVKYIANGFGIGAGLMDEDGRNTSWMGTESVCLSPVAGTGPGSTSWACGNPSCGRTPANPGGYPCPNMNINTATDLVSYQTQYAAKYFGTIKAGVTSATSGLLYMGCDTLGDWGTPPRQEILAGALPYLDILFTNWVADSTESAQRFQVFSTARGDAPILNFNTLCANLDSAAASFGVQACLDNTQPARAQRWYDMTNTQLNTLGSNNTYQWVGNVWWGLLDFIPGENTNWGLKTNNDNAYDASEAASGSVTCSSPLTAYTCGSEPAPGGGAVRPFGNLLGGATGVIAANALWLNVGAPVTQPFAPIPWIFV